MNENFKGSIEVHVGNGELEQVDLISRRKLIKHDRMIDASTLWLLVDLKPAEFKILMRMYIISTKQGFVEDKLLDLEFSRMTKAESIKELIKKDLIRKAEWVKYKKKTTKGYLINPFHFRKTRQTEQYFELLERYNSFKEEEVLMIMVNSKEQITEEYKEVVNELKERKMQ